MATTTWTQEDLDAVQSAVSSCALTVTYGGPPSRTITRHSLEAMRALLAEIRAALGDAAGTRQGYRRAAIKGFNE